MSEAIPDDVMNLAFEAHGNLTMIFGDEDAEIIARAILADRAGREAEIEEKDERIAELEREAEVVSAEFEGDCWRMVRRLLEMTGYDFSHSEGVTAEEAFEHLYEDIKSGSAQIKRASDERDNLRAELSRVKVELAEAVRLLKPFAKLKCVFGGKNPDDIPQVPDSHAYRVIWNGDEGRCDLTLGQFRRAHAFVTRVEAKPC